MGQRFTIEGRFCSLNEFYRMHPQVQGRVKRENDELVAWSAKAAKLKPCRVPVVIRVRWVEPNRRRDLDNIAFGIKFIQDGLVKAGVLANDTAHEVAGFEHSFAYDSQHPRIEVELVPR